MRNTGSKIVSLENFEDINENFILRSPNKGKLFRGPNWNAFNRESLGTIPRKSENILFQEKNTDAKKGFLSQSERFSEFNRKETVKYAFPGPGNYKVDNETLDKTSVSSNPSYSTKGYGNGFISKSERFDDQREYYEKFYPGPGQYANVKSSISEIKNPTNFRYNSLYDKKQVKSLKISKDNPGPGYYDPIIPLLLTKDQNDKENFFFYSKDNRFKHSLNDKDSLNPGPGRYFNYPESLVKDLDKTSFFFKKNIPVKEDPIEKHLNIPRVQRFIVPGPGDYDLRKGMIEEGKANLQNSLGKRRPLLDERQKVTEKHKESELDHNMKLNSSNKESHIAYKSPFESSKKGIKSVFVSKSLKDSQTKLTHVPGPSYYNPQDMPSKISYNCNTDKMWI